MDVQIKTKNLNKNSFLYKKPIFKKEEGLIFPQEIQKVIGAQIRGFLLEDKQKIHTKES